MLTEIFQDTCNVRHLEYRYRMILAIMNLRVASLSPWFGEFQVGFYVGHVRASMRKNLSLGDCEQHRRRPACASAQSDQRLCYSL